jgi:uncharacterized phage-associated protein
MPNPELALSVVRFANRVVYELRDGEVLKMVDARLVANRFLELAAGEGHSLTPMQVLKLVYIAHGWSLGLDGAPLIEQPVEAWQYGPVIPELYNAVKKFGASTVQGPLPLGFGSRGDTLTPDQEALVNDVFKIYGNMGGLALSRITHAAGTPWSQTYKPGNFGAVISRDLIQDHYERLARDRRNGSRVQ